MTSYLPDAILRRLSSEGGARVEPFRDRLQGAVIVVDISGFTSMTEVLAQQGAAGIEKLSGTLDDFFGAATGRIYAHGGDVVRFAGDALLAVWPAGDAQTAETATRRAVECALDLRDRLSDYRTGAGLPLSIKIGVGCGEFWVMHLGGVDQWWDWLVVGAAFTQAFAALDRAGPTQAIVSWQAWSHVEEHFEGEPLPMGAVLLRSGRGAERPGTASRTPVSPEVAGAARSFLPAAVRSRLAAGHEQWMGELRPATVLFVALPELNEATPLDRAQAIVQCLQTEIYRFGGSINKLSVDDKGTALLAGFGLPPAAHEDDPVRAVRAARAVFEALRELGLRSSIGISTGRLFCGLVGSSLRREYTLLGDVVNLAARLMQAALGEILCDETTCRLARSRVEFQRVSGVIIKGKAAPLDMYRPLGLRREPDRSDAGLVGRERERALLEDKVRALCGDGEAGIVVLEGEAGIGKSRLAEEAVRLARAAGADVAIGRGSPMEGPVLYHAWQPVFAQLLGLDPRPEPEAAAGRVERYLEEHLSLGELAPLLNPVLGLELPETGATAHLSGPMRGENTRDLLLEILQDAAGRRPLLVVLDDAQWQDSGSWGLSLAAARRGKGLLLVLAYRPLPGEPAEEYSEMLRLPSAARIPVATLSLQETSRLVQAALQVAEVPEKVTRFVFERAEGHPLFTEELAYALVEKGHVAVSDGRCSVVNGFLDASGLDVPDTLQGVITSRIDRLSPAEQLAVRVASVLGRRFLFRLLCETYPVETDKPRLEGYLAEAEHVKLLEKDHPEPELAFHFRHGLTHQTAYESLLHQQREQLHRSAARWYEAQYRDNPAPHYTILAHHWTRGNDPAKAMDYCEKAGEMALRNGAYREAARHLADADAMEERSSGEPDPFRRARRLRLLGESLLGLGLLSEGRRSLFESLHLLGHPEPGGRVALFVRLGVELTRQLIRRSLPVRTRPAHADRPEGRQVAEAERSTECLSLIYYLGSERERLAHAAFKMLNLAERMGPSPALARAYGVCSIVTGIAGLHALAARYARLARETAVETDNPAALAGVLEVTSVYALGVGDTARARVQLAEGIRLCRQLRDWQHWGESMAAAAQTAYYRGRFREGCRLWEELYERAGRRADDLHQAWGLNGRSEAVLRLGGEGHAAEAVEMLKRALRLLADNADRISRLSTYGLLSEAYWRGGDVEAARASAEEGLRLAVEMGSPTGYYALQGYAGIADTLLAVAESTRGDRRAACRGSARKACRLLSQFGRVFPIGRPLALRCRGIQQWLAGRKRAALRSWRKGLLAARRVEMPYEEGVLHLEFGRRLATSDPQRREHLARAIDLFSSSSADHALHEARRCLAADAPAP